MRHINFFFLAISCFFFSFNIKSVFFFQTRSSKSNYLELHFRPEDPYSHPAFGELRQCSSLLLKISKKKDAVTSENRQTPLSPEIPNLESVPGFSESGVEGQQLISESDLLIVSEGNNAKILEEESPVRLCAAIVARVPQAYYFEGESGMLLFF